MILRDGTFSPAEMSYKRLTHYGNGIRFVIESVHWLPNENANFAGKQRNRSI